MKFFVAFVALVAVVSADVSHIVGKEASAQVLRQEQDVQPESYRFVYETDNGISGQATGVLRNVGKDNEKVLVSEGSNTYTAPDGRIIKTEYVADENGFQPQGDHLPTPPPPQPIPEYIQRSLEYTAAHPQQPEGRRNY